MNLIHRRGWDSPASQITPEHAMPGRRAAMASLLAPAAFAPLAFAPLALAQANAVPPLPDRTANALYAPGRALTSERDGTTYNNFYEFGSSKSISRDAARMPRRPWTIKVEGLVENPREFDIDDLIRLMPVDDRTYRLRCVEAWAMTLPWTGFPLAALVNLVKPLASAKYLSYVSAQIPAVMPGLRQSWYPWPHMEGCTLAEAMNPLSYVAIGLYGKPLEGANGAPIRMLFPWKFGFKSAKSIVKIVFQEARPPTFWGTIQPAEYGFWANVNPAVPHARWSQASERLIGGGNDRVPTQMWNGYGEFVASMYDGLQGERLFA